MKNELTQLVSKPFTRRKFLEGVGAVGATAALASCGGSSKGPQSLFKDNPANVPVPPINGVVVAGSAPHNCGGRCVSKAYVENGVVKRIVTDESPENVATDAMQRRACVRCHAHKGYMYRADRLLKPLKQMGNRGDVNGFVEISWDQAFTEVAAKTKAIRDQYGASALYNHYTSGDGAAVPRGGAGNDGGTAVAQRVLRLLGGYVGFRGDYSYPTYEHISGFCVGAQGGTPSANSPQDVVNADQIILWARNTLEMIEATNAGYYLTLAKEKGVKVIAIDSRVSQTSATIADEHIGIISGTDAAMELAMMYHLLNEPTLAGGAAGSLLDIPFIRKYVHGFFDSDLVDPTRDPFYHADGPSKSAYFVPAGASLSAYIMGNIKHAENGAASIYPATIGYNVNPDDPLYGKRTPIYGQVPKTPEWAEAITGVPAARIRSLAESFVQKKTHFWMGGGWQRNMEAEQALMAAFALGAITKNFGVAGRCFGMSTAKTSAGSLNMTRVPGEGPAAGYNEANLPAGYYDTTKLTPGVDKYIWQRIRWSFPCFLWPDLVKNGGTGKSDWNDAQIKKLGPIKAIYNFAGNILVNQTGDSNQMKKILSDRTKAELIVVADLYMTASAAYGDYVLPAAAAFERTAANSGSECLIYMGKAVEPLGQAKSDYDIGVGIATALGPTYKDTFTEKNADGTNRTEEDWVHWAWDQNKFTDMTYADWKQKGIRTSNTAAAPTPKNNTFLADPTKAPLATPTGKFEVYAQAMIEDHLAQGHDNVDTTPGAPALLGPLHDGSTAPRFAYPIPMYIPLVEGMHADGSHPDVLNLKAKGYTLMFQTWHMQYRSHSTHNSNAFLNECYKKDANGQPAFLSPTRPRGNVWDEGIYEPVWINPATASQFGIVNGDRVLVTNDRGRIYASAKVTERAHPGFVFIGQGAWHSTNAAGIDVGGCANTLTAARPTRIAKGMTLATGTLVKIEKA